MAHNVHFNCPSPTVPFGQLLNEEATSLPHFQYNAIKGVCDRGIMIPIIGHEMAISITY